jgi:hypothetical protein
MKVLNWIEREMGEFFGNLLSAISGDKIYFSFIMEIYEVF